ncbi:MAG: DUF4266 domain-containing protein [Burkholderiales bacterium]
MSAVILMRRAILVALSIALAGCASMTPPKPWEKGDLARPSMQVGSDHLEAKYTDHIYQSKEMTSGGQGVGGGGCGCN